MKIQLLPVLICALSGLSHADDRKMTEETYSKDFIHGVIGGITAVNEYNKEMRLPPIFCKHVGADTSGDEILEDDKKIVEEIYTELTLSVGSGKYSKYQYGISDLPPSPIMVILEVVKKHYPCKTGK